MHAVHRPTRKAVVGSVNSNLPYLFLVEAQRYLRLRVPHGSGSEPAALGHRIRPAKRQSAIQRVRLVDNRSQAITPVMLKYSHSSSSLCAPSQSARPL